MKNRTIMTGIIETNKLLRDLVSVNRSINQNLVDMVKQNKKIIDLLEYIQAQTQ